MKSKKKYISSIANAIVPVSKHTISSVVSVMTSDQKQMLKALGVFLL